MTASSGKVKISHELKILPCYFKEILSGDKLFEIRRNDRGFQKGDKVRLNCFEPDDKYDDLNYTGESIVVEITYVTNFEQKEGYVVFGFKVLDFDLGGDRS